ncbi:MAG: VCBS repeat-containing protein [Deltaproteobacteria bacterium]|jgi:hypothetical protein|nr:VCBS repeat-containing protein [Deltaproteobacteria bacterium]MBW2532430.1 VCBS repeat-containing protein [Deltaproteobacteria bacterium]
MPAIQIQTELAVPRRNPLPRGWLALMLCGIGASACGGDDEESSAIVAVEPAVGSARGGETVTIRGSAFEQGAGVWFGDAPAEEVTWIGAEALEVVTPMHLAETVNVTVSGPSESATAPDGFTFEPLDLEFVQAAAHYVPDFSTVVVDDAAVGDFDLDGAPDVLVAARGTPSRLLRNSGFGAFVDELPPPEEIEPSDAIPTWVHSTRRMLVDDLDGDDDLDVFLCNRWGQPSRIYENDGAGEFSQVASALPEVSEECRGAVLVDIDGDEDRDLVLLGRGRIGRGKSYLRVYERTGDAMDFSPVAAFEEQADIDGDPVGLVHVAPAAVAAEYTVTADDAASGAAAGHGSFVFSAEPGTAVFGHTVQTLQDVPDAVELDLKGSSAPVTVALRLVDAEDEAYTYDLGALGAAWQRVRAESPAAWTATGGDADGLLDLPVQRLELVVSDAVGGATGDLFVDDIRLNVPRTGPILVEDFERIDFQLSWDEILHSISAGDLDGDADLDFVLSSEHGAAPVRLRLLLSDGAAGGGQIALSESPSSAFEATAELMAWTLLHDVDADDDLDVMALGSDGQDRLFVNDGRAHFFDDTIALLPVDAARGIAAEAADLDLDGQSELLLANYDATNRIYRSRGASGFVDVTPVMPIHTARSVRFLPLDADGDGDLDLFELNQDGERSVLFVSVEPKSDR